jgi:hypothetical protein
MRKIIAFFAVAIILSAFTVYTQDAFAEEYNVKEGDTLWDISDDKLSDTFLWPKLWKINPHIKNPDLIYPGDMLMIPSKEALMKMFPSEMEEPAPVAEPEPAEAEPVVKAPEEVPPGYIVDKKLYLAIGWISTAFKPSGQVFASPSERSVLGNNDIVYLKAGESLENGDSFLVVRDVKTVKHPKTGKKMGRQIRVAGIVEVFGEDDNVPKANVTETFEEIQVGDWILPYHDTEPPVEPDIIRTPDKKGYIVETYINHSITSANMIVFLDKGTDDGLESYS